MKESHHQQCQRRMVSRYQHTFPVGKRPLKVLISFGNDFRIEASAVLRESVQKQKEHNLIRAMKVLDRLFLVRGGADKERYCYPC